MQGTEQYRLFLKPLAGEAEAVEVAVAADGRPPVWANDDSGFFFTTRAQTLQTVTGDEGEDECAGEAAVVGGGHVPGVRSDSLWRADMPSLALHGDCATPTTTLVFRTNEPREHVEVLATACPARACAGMRMVLCCH